MSFLSKAFGILACSFMNYSLFGTIPDRYQGIIERNSFGLNPPPPIAVETNQAPPPANVRITGFATLNGELRAYFVIQPKDPKDSVQYLSLPQGQREGILEVIKIAEHEGEVTVRNSGVELELSLKNNGMNPMKPLGAPQVAANPHPNPLAQISPVYNPASASSVVANYAPEKNARTVMAQPSADSTGFQPTMPNATFGNRGNAANSTMTMAHSGRPSQSPVVAGNGPSPVVFSMNDFNRSGPKAIDQAPMRTLDPITQRIVMEVEHEEATARGAVMPPLPPLPPR